jgi:uncharacterized protein
MKKILSIDGGGVRGIIPVIILTEIEKQAGQPISNLFDLFVGTSTGGMLVLSLNLPDPLASMRPACSAAEAGRLFHEWGNRAFGHELSKTDQLSSDTSPENRIEDMFREYFGNTLLSSSIKPTMVTAFDLSTSQPFFFNSDKTMRDCGSEVLMWQAARATTAVPTHFGPLRLSISSYPSHENREVLLVDGSVYASNPAMCALVEARALFPREEDFLLVSLGCGEAVHASASADSQRRRRRMFDLSLTAQSACVNYLTRAFLAARGKDQLYFRIQADLAPGSASIDDASEDNLLNLERRAREAIAKHAGIFDNVLDRLTVDRPEDFHFVAA